MEKVEHRQPQTDTETNIYRNKETEINKIPRAHTERLIHV